MTLIISIDSSIAFNFKWNSDGMSINILCLTIDIITKPKHIVFKEIIEEYNRHGF